MPVLRQIQVHPKEGLKQTLFQMNLLERKALNDVSFVRWVYSQFSSDCTACIPGKVWRYIQDNFNFVPDEYDEFIAAPYAIIETKQGDCDDFALFIKACMDVLGGWRTHYLLLAKEKNKYTHICVFAHRGKQGNEYTDPVIVDGANANFNIIPGRYKYYKII